MSDTHPRTDQGDSPKRDPFEALFAQLAEIDPEAAAALRIILRKQDDSVDADNAILERVLATFGPMIERVVRETVAHLEQVKKKQEAQSEPDSRSPVASDSDIAEASEPPPTRLTVATIAEPFMAGLNESLMRANEEARRRAAAAKEKAEELSLDAVDNALRAYFFLFGLPGRTIAEVKTFYGGLTTKQQGYVDNIAANLVSNVIWVAGASLVAWALLS